MAKLRPSAQRTWNSFYINTAKNAEKPTLKSREVTYHRLKFEKKLLEFSLHPSSVGSAQLESGGMGLNPIEVWIFFIQVSFLQKLKFQLTF